MTIWIMNVDTESCDNYPGVCSWDHEPTKEEIWKKMLELFPSEIVEGDDYPETFTLDGVQYSSLAYPTVFPVDTSEHKG